MPRLASGFAQIGLGGTETTRHESVAGDMGGKEANESKKRIPYKRMLGWTRFQKREGRVGRGTNAR